MKGLFYFIIFILLSSEIMMTTSCKVKDEIQMPVAEKIKKEIICLGDTRTDYFYWMNERENPKVIKYLEDENEYLSEKLKHTEQLQEVLFDEIASRIKPDEQSVPYKDNGYFYYQRYEEQKEHPVYCRKKENLNNPEEVLLDVNNLAEGHPYFHVNDFSISFDNKLIAYSTDTLGRRKYDIRFKVLKTGKILPDIISNTDGELVWANDNKTVFYIKKDDETLREYQVWKHILGTPSEKDKLIFEEKNEAFYISLSKSKSDKYIFIASYSTLSTEYQILNADKPDDNFRIIISRSENHEYHAEPHGNDLYISTNFGGAENFKIVKTSLTNPNVKNAEEIIPYDKNVFIEDFDVFKDYLVINERKDGLMQLRIFNLLTKKTSYVDCGEDAYEIWISDNDEFDTNMLRFGYSSLTTPTSYFDFNMKTGEKILLKQKFAGIDFNKENYEAKRLFATASDGVKIPVSIVYRKGLQLTGQNPLLVYAYGSYGYSSDDGFRSSVLSLLNRGFVYAVAHVRGGQELGRKWYEDGKLLHKKNTFTDFIACTKYLQDLGYSSPNLTFAEGGSAGGLLTGAVSNMQPELYAGIISEVPFVDVVTTMLDESIPLTTGEYDEWGNPHEKKYYDYMLSYSPYDNVKKQNYPAMMITAGLHDSQVQYWEPAKWTAKLREYNTSNNPIYLYTNMDAGHGGASGRYKAYKETALIYAFILDVLNEK